MHLFDENYCKIDNEVVHPIWRKIRYELDDKRFISRDDISRIMEEAKTAAKELIGPDVFDNPYIYWVIPLSGTKIVTMPRLGLSCVDGVSRGELMTAISFPSGDVEYHGKCKGFV